MIAHVNRKGDNLFTGSIVALDVDTGKMKWYFQSSPHDTHDWDATQTPVLFDGEVERPEAQAARAGGAQRLLLRDGSRRPGKALVVVGIRQDRTGRRAMTRRGSRFPNPAKDPQVDGALVSPNQAGATELAAAQLQSATGLST